MSVAASTFRIHGDAFHLANQTHGFRLLRFTIRLQTPRLFFFPVVRAVHEASDVVSSMSFIFFEDSEPTSSISHAMEDEHDSKERVS